MMIRAVHRPSCRRIAAVGVVFVLVLGALMGVQAQDFLAVHDEPVPPEVERVYQRGLDYLVANQDAAGSWPDSRSQVGVVGLCVLAILAHGDDPNAGPYADSVRRAVDYIIKQANTESGYIGNTMYNHGFATLALAEAYGQLDDDRIGPTLKRAVDLITSSQSKNPTGAWRYGPTSTDADTTVSGAIMVALFAARNAGIDVSDESIAKALGFYKRCQSSDGGFGYTSPGGSNAPRTAIGVLVYALAKEKDNRVYTTAFKWLHDNQSQNLSYHQFYYLYYAAQAFFHSDPQTWREWNDQNIRSLIESQNTDGSWSGSQGASFTTATAMLSLALNYRFLPIYER